MKLILKRASQSEYFAFSKIANKAILAGKYPLIASNKPWSRKTILATTNKIKRKQSFAFVAKIGKNIVAMVGAWPLRGRRAHAIDLGWFVSPDYFSRGVMSKLLKFSVKELRKIGFKRAECEIVPINKASIRVAEKVGFKKEGVKRKAFRLDSGKYTNLNTYGRLL